MEITPEIAILSAIIRAYHLRQRAMEQCFQADIHNIFPIHGECPLSNALTRRMEFDFLIWQISMTPHIDEGICSQTGNACSSTGRKKWQPRRHNDWRCSEATQRLPLANGGGLAELPWKMTVQSNKGVNISRKKATWESTPDNLNQHSRQRIRSNSPEAEGANDIA